jgi:hypothetical protein
MPERVSAFSIRKPALQLTDCSAHSLTDPWVPFRKEEPIAPLLIGYARVSTDTQDLTAQREGLAALGVTSERTYVDHGLTGTNRERPGLREAIAACRGGDTLVVTKLDRLARSLPDAREILADLTAGRSSSALAALARPHRPRWTAVVQCARHGG